MTSHERRVMALMRLHGLTKAGAEKRAKTIESAIKKNPAPKRKTAARAQKAAVGYVNRVSQVTKKPPTKRLKKRRTINLQTPRGVFPNPAPRLVTKAPKPAKEITVEQSLDKKNWTIFARFPDTPDGGKNAIEYAKAYSIKEPYLHLRVMTK